MQALGPAAVQYRRSLLRSAVALLLAAWGTREALGPQAEEAVMSAVELPPFRCAAAHSGAACMQRGRRQPLAFWFGCGQQPASTRRFSGSQPCSSPS